MKTKKKVMDWRVLCVALVCLTSYGIYAISQGINGTLMSAIIGIICLIVGIELQTPNFMKLK